MTFEQAKSTLPIYYHFLSYLKKQGYVFWDFRTFWKANKDSLPEKLIVIRHDIHQNDIELAYTTYAIEKEMLGDSVATYYIMLDFPPEMQHIHYPTYRKNYLNLISFLHARQVEVQPHISIIDMYVKKFRPVWKNKTEDELRDIFESNYEIIKYNDGIEIKICGEDFFKLNEMNLAFINILKEYNAMWEDNTGIAAYSYASHGSPTPINHVINNSDILKQRALLQSGVYLFDTYNYQIGKRIRYLGDTYIPGWIKYPVLIKPGKYQFLMHPKNWVDPDARMRALIANGSLKRL